MNEYPSGAGSVAEAALAHVVGDKTEAAYFRTDLWVKRSLMMEAWATYVTREPTETAQIIQLAEQRAATS